LKKGWNTAKTKNMNNKRSKKELKEKCQKCKADFIIWVDGLDSDVEKTEDMKSHSKNYCPVCNMAEKL